MKSNSTIENKLLKENPFKVPDGYFENLPAAIGLALAQTTISEPAPKVRRISWQSSWAVAASMVLLMGLGYSILSTFENNPRKTDSLYSEHYISRLDTYILTHEPDTYHPEDAPSVNSEAIESYLMEQGISSLTLASLE